MSDRQGENFAVPNPLPEMFDKLKAEIADREGVLGAISCTEPSGCLRVRNVSGEGVEMANVCETRTRRSGSYLPELPHEPKIMTEEMKKKALARGLSESDLVQVGEELPRQFTLPTCRHCGSLYVED